jgi:hypothetical protein
MSPEIIRFLKILHMRFSVNSSGISDCQAHWSKWMPSLYNPINMLSVYSISEILLKFSVGDFHKNSKGSLYFQPF